MEAEPLDDYYVNITRLCGRNNFTVWNNVTNDFGDCFYSLLVISPAHAILAAVSAYYIGLRSRPFYLRTREQKWVLYTRGLATLLLAATPAVVLVSLYAFNVHLVNDDGLSEVVETSAQVLSWLLHFIYIMLLLERISPSIRGRRGALFVFVMVGIVDAIQCRSTLVNTVFVGPEKYIYETHAIVRLILLAIYLLTLIPAGDDAESQYEELLTNENTDERSGLLAGGGLRNYSGFHESTDPQYLGVAKEDAPWLSKIFFYWVNPLIKKGLAKQLNHPDDVFDVPHDLQTPIASELFQAKLDDPEYKSLLRALYELYGKQFFLIGILKFIADCAGFASPILLNLVVKFMEDKREDIRLGYLYAFGLAASSFVVAMANTHFNLQISELKLKIRASVVTAVYKHTVNVSSVELNKFNAGEVINYMSTDTDRIVNFAPSLHAVWSLPFQLGVTIFLLHQQLGVSSFTGVGICILMIPLNKVVADKIGDLSTKMMAAKDNRVQSMSELLAGIRVVKYFGWEPYFNRRINDARTEELKYLKGRKYLDAICVYLWATTPVLISVLTFATYVLIGNEFTAAKVFTSVALFAMLTGPLNAFPWALNGLVESVVSLRRINEFLSLKKIDRDAYYDTMDQVADLERTDEAVVAIARGLFSHTTSTVLTAADFRLGQINVMVDRGDFVGVVGKVGSGKSSLLASILGEVTKVGGQISVDWPESGIGFVPQEPWLQQGTIRDNILFGKMYRQNWYNQVVEACSLKEDLKQLAKGDMTNVGEHGVMLSGGQKARVALARAVYQDKEVYLIDDIYSALDVPVGNHIFKKCIMGLLRNKTRVLCTHHPKYLTSATRLILLDDGKVLDVGSPSQILPKLDVKLFEENNGNSSNGSSERNRKVSEASSEDEPAPVREEVIDQESRESGVVKLSVYKSYWHAVGNILSPLIVLSLILMQATRNYTDVWLANWVSSDEKNATSANSTVNYYLTVYGSIAVANSVFSFIRAFLFAYGGVCAARAIHQRLLRVILRAKAYFFDTTPTGRILNRFSSDLYTVDDSLPFILNILLAQIVGVVGPIIVCAYAVPWIVLVLVPLAFILHDVQARYRPASRDLKRIGSVSLSPIYAHFTDTLSGLSTIRAMKAASRFLRENEEKVEANQKAQYAGVAASQWLELRLQLLGCAVITGISVIAVIEHHTNAISPGLVGLAISYALGITGKLSGLVSAFTESEKELVAVERCKQYIDEVETEDFEGGVTSTPYNWPTEGAYLELKNQRANINEKNIFLGILVFKDVCFRYGQHLPLALKDLSFETKCREKVGIVGRTGSGKSSIFQVNQN